MNKSQLVSKMAKDTKMSKSACENIVNSCMANIKSSLKKGQSVTLIGFGTFSVVTRAARTGRNPSTGKPMQIPAKDVPKFSPGTNLKNKVAGK